jgi:hypothetical protein
MALILLLGPARAQAPEHSKDETPPDLPADLPADLPCDLPPNVTRLPLGKN